MLPALHPPPTPFLPTGLVKVESESLDQIWLTVAALIEIDGYPFWLSQSWPITLRIGVFSLHCMALIVKSLQTRKYRARGFSIIRVITSVVLELRCAWKGVLTAICGIVDISEVLGVIFTRDEFSLRCTENQG